MIKTDLILGGEGFRDTKAKGEMRKPAHSQGKSFTPREENGNSNLIHTPLLNKECKVPRSTHAQGKHRD